jgi:hypothetical protein
LKGVPVMVGVVATVAWEGSQACRFGLSFGLVKEIDSLRPWLLACSPG